MPAITQATVKNIDLFPLKSFSVFSVPEASVLPSGALKRDRQWALKDDQGRIVNAKRTPLIHHLQTLFDRKLHNLELIIRRTQTHTTISEGRESWHFQFPDQLRAIEEVLSDYFGFSVQFQENTQSGYPDDLISPGPTVIGSATLDAISEWFPGLSPADLRKRFRANILLDTEEPFWEDRLWGTLQNPKRFRIGEVEFLGINPCQRCVVPSRDPETGETWPLFQKEFVSKRKETLPEFAIREQYNHYYRLAVNTQISPENRGTTIRCGDTVRLCE